MSDFAYAYFSTELEKLDVPPLEGIFEKVQKTAPVRDAVVKYRNNYSFSM